MRNERGVETKVRSAQSGLVFQLQQGCKLDTATATAPSDKQMQENRALVEEMSKIASEKRQELLDEDTKQLLASEQSYAPDPITNILSEPQFLFLGTSSMKPTTHRGASAIYVFNKAGAMLMDVAEGTYG